MAEKHNCDDCRATHKVYGTEPDCSKCMPELLPENVGVLEVYNATCGQYITDSIFTIMDKVRIPEEDQMYCLGLVQRALGEVMREKK